MNTLEQMLDQAVPDGTLCVYWTMAGGLPNSDLFTHTEFVQAVLHGAFSGCTNVRFEMAPTPVSTKEVTTQVTIDTVVVTVTHPERWKEQQLEEWLRLVVQDAQVIDVGIHVTLGDEEVPDLAYDEGGNAQLTVAELMR